MKNGTANYLVIMDSEVICISDIIAQIITSAQMTRLAQDIKKSQTDLSRQSVRQF